jgi:hypothetical protein
MELKELKKHDWSTSTYSGEVPEEIRWKGRDMTTYDTIVSMGTESMHVPGPV